MVWLIVIIVGVLLFNRFFGLKGHKFDYYFGVPGSGKTTVAAWLAKYYLKRNRTVYSNVPIKGALEIDKSDIGRFNIHDGCMLLDEAGIDFSNRNWKGLLLEQIMWFKKYRHFGMDIAIFSQSYDDADVTLRRLATNFYLMKNSFIPYFVKRKRILKRIKINKDTHQIEDQFYFQFLGTRYIFCPPLWKLFQKEERYELPEKEFKVYQ